MWNQFLNESRSEHKFDNTPVLVLGNKHSGKRSLIDSLFDISKTSLYNKKAADTNNKLRVKGPTPIIDYAYINVLDIYDPDYRTHSKLELYFVEDKYNLEVFTQLQKAQLLRKAVVVIMLDFTNPWSFMQDLDSWIKFLYQLQKNAGFSISELQEMSESITKIYKQYKEPQFDESGKIKKNFKVKETEQPELDIPLPDGVLANNIRMPFIVCVNKCDLQTSVLRDESVNKIQYILYNLRQFCVKYGGTLIYTSIKNNSNLNVLYEYILHRAYDMPLRFKAESINEQSIFIPFGYDNPNLIQDSVLKMDMSKSYTEMIPEPANKKIVKEESIVEEDAEFFKKYINTSSSATSFTTGVNSSAIHDESSSSSNPKTTEVTKFFERLLNSNTSGGSRINNTSNGNQNKNITDEQRRNQAQNTLLKHTMKQVELTKLADKKK